MQTCFSHHSGQRPCQAVSALMSSIELGHLCWIRAAFIVLVLQLAYFGRGNSLGEGGYDWESVTTLGQEDGESFKAVVQPLVEMAANSYRYPGVIPIQGWTLVEAVAPIHGGMHATVYKENGDSKRMVLSFRGTDISGDEASMADLCADVAIWISKSGTAPHAENCSRFSSQTLDYYNQAVDYTEKVMRSHPDSFLLITGHSLGAGLALLVTATLDINPSLPVVAFSAPGVAKVLDGRSLLLSSHQARRVFVISDEWDEIMRTSWEDQVGTTCLYPTPQSNDCTVCFNETGVTSTWQMQQPPISNCEQKYTEEEEDEPYVERIPGFTDACWSCFLSTHILSHVMDLVDLGVKPVCEFHTTEPLDRSICPKQPYNC